jgi:hypothetical protein
VDGYILADFVIVPYPKITPLAAEFAVLRRAAENTSNANVAALPDMRVRVNNHMRLKASAVSDYGMRTYHNSRPHLYVLAELR